MSQICSSDLLVKNSIQAVVEPLKDGLECISIVYEALIDGDVDSITGKIFNYDYIRERIERAKQSLERSEQVASTGLKSLDENIEILTRDEGNLELELSATQQILDSLKIEQKSNKKILNQSKFSMEMANREIRLSEEILQKQEDRRYNASVVTGVGAGLLLIPVVGWIAGSAMVIGGAVELSQASEAIKIAEEEKRESEEAVEKYKNKVSDYKSKISQTEHEIRQKHDQKEKIRKESRKLKKQRAAIAEFQEKVRRAVHSLSVLSGKADVAECQTRRFILQEPLMKVMGDVIKAAGEIGGNQILADDGMRRLLKTMKEKQSQADSSVKEKRRRRSGKGSSWKKLFCLL